MAAGDAATAATVLELRATDTPGPALPGGAAPWRTSGADVRSARISTLGGEVVDAFYLAGELSDRRPGPGRGRRAAGGDAAPETSVAAVGRTLLRSAYDSEDGFVVFDTLSDRLSGIFSKLRSKGRLTDADIDATAREIRLALLEADVALPVVKDFIARLKERARGAEVSKALNPAQQVIKIVHEELVATLGGEARRLQFAKHPPTVIMLAGLQGSGKTTLAGKLARWLKAQGHQPLLVACRPAAPQRRQPAAGARRPRRRRGLRAASPATASATRSASPASRSSTPGARCATSSSSTPPAGSASTPR